MPKILLPLLCLLPLFSFASAQDDQNSQDAVTIFNQAQDAHEKGDLAEAVNLYDKAISVFPEFPEAEYQRAVAEIALGKTDEAERSFRRAVELRPDWTLPMAGLGSLLVEKNAVAEAEKLLSRVIEMEPQNPPALVALADLRLKTSASAASLQDLLAKIAPLTVKPGTTSALWTARSGLENALGKKAEARSSLAKALGLDPKNKTALFQAAQFALDDNDLDRAKDAAERLEKLAATGDAINLLKAAIAAADGDLETATNLLATLRDQTTATNLRGRIAAVRNSNPADLEKQLTDKPNDGAILGKLCSLYRRDDPAKALDYCRKAAEAEPNNISHVVGFGAALVQAKQYDQAVNIFRQLLKISPDNSTVHANLAAALFQLKRYPEAKVEYEWITNAQPTSAAAFYLLAIVHDQLNEYIDAMANYQQFLKLADPVKNKLYIEKVNLRLPGLQKQIKSGSKK